MDIWGSRLLQQQLSEAELNWEPPLSAKPPRGKRVLRLIMDDGKILETIMLARSRRDSSLIVRSVTLARLVYFS